ncbi:MFS transporter [Paenibacillus herberti]|uniref:MFS transporter n=1 Tax=Paenibacillus herberti TaxID=1619309 RepID=A0A229NVD2_9BACL|nr:MFS transporter [Paenibacillus herberti]OXM13866.1 MFS transporter [Paenibacillus herberti]
MNIPAAQAQAQTIPASPMRALRFQKAFLILLAARMVTRFGDSIDSIAYSWMVYQLTGSKMLMGSLFALNFVPGILFSLFAGVLVDRLPKKQLLFFTYAMRGTIVALTAFLLWKGWLQTWHLFLFTFLNSTLECFSSPAETSLVPRLLPKPLLLSGNSLSTSVSRISELAGLAVAGGIISWIGLSGAILVDSITFYLSALLLLLLRIPNGEPLDETDADQGKATTTPDRDFWKELKHGLSFVRSQTLILYTLLTGAVLNLCLTPMNVMNVVYVEEVLHSGPITLSTLGISLMSAIILSSLGLSAWGSKFRKSSLVVIGCMLLGTGQALYYVPTLLTWQPLVVAGFAAFISGFAIPFINTPLSTYIMEVTPHAMLGRVSSLSSMIAFLFIPIGSLTVGAVGSFIPVQTLYLAAGLMMFAPALFLMTRKNFMKI